MSESKTKTLGLNKPQPTDFYNIEVFNENADIVDTAVQQMQEQVKDTEQAIESVETPRSFKLVLPRTGWEEADDGYRVVVRQQGIIKRGYNQIVGVDLTQKEERQEYEDCRVQADERKHEVDGEMVFVAEDKPSMDLYANVLQLKVEVM